MYLYFQKHTPPYLYGRNGEINMINIKNKYGLITITDKVVARIVGNIATSCFGVVGMASRNAADSFADLLKWENMDKGINITCMPDNTLEVALHIIVTSGVNIPAISDSIRNKVCYSVEKLTSVKVSKVSIIVESLKM